MPIKDELAGKVAVVTGSGRNIGRAIALDLADAGAAIVVNTRSNQAEADALVGDVDVAAGDDAAALLAVPAVLEAAPARPVGPAGQPVEARSILGALRGSVEERMEVGVVEPRNDVGKTARRRAARTAGRPAMSRPSALGTSISRV